MQNLPLELIQHICAYLDRTSLLQVSLTSKACHAASSAILYREIWIRVDIDCTQAVNRWHSILSSTQAWHHVHKVHLKNEPDCAVEAGCAGIKQLRATSACMLPDRASKFDRDWRPLARLVEELPNLEDIYYNLVSQISPSLLQVIESKQTCRLHMETFYLRSLVSHCLDTVKLDEYEAKLARSPCLHTITVRQAPFAHSQISDHNNRVVVDMASGLAPNLRRIHIHHQQACSMSALMVLRKPWKGTELGMIAEGQVGQIESLTGDIFSLETWTSRINLSQLQELRGVHLTIEELQLLTAQPRMSSLHTLEAELYAPGIDDLLDDQHIWNTLMKDWFGSLSALDSLHLDGYFEMVTVETIAKQRGQRLRTLHISPWDHDWASMISKQRSWIEDMCPNLEKLVIELGSEKNTNTI